MTKSLVAGTSRPEAVLRQTRRPKAVNQDILPVQVTL
jgi:hypothetical protein